MNVSQGNLPQKSMTNCEWICSSRTSRYWFALFTKLVCSFSSFYTNSFLVPKISTERNGERQIWCWTVQHLDCGGNRNEQRWGNCKELQMGMGMPTHLQMRKSNTGNLNKFSEMLKCQYPLCDTILWCCKMLLSGET